MFKHLSLTTLLIALPLFASCSCDTDSKTSNNTARTLLESPSEESTASTEPSRDVQALAKKLKQGMQKKDIEKQIGMPDYSPTDGLEYYSSDTSQTLILDYRDEKLDATNKLKSFQVDSIGE